MFFKKEKSQKHIRRFEKQEKFERKNFSFFRNSLSNFFRVLKFSKFYFPS